MAIFLRLLALLLFLIALLTGGCAIGFTYLLVTDGAGSSIMPFWASGLALGGICLLAGLRLWHLARRRTAAKRAEGPR